MATSNAIGSNVFDILICLGLPWFLQTAVVSPGSVVRVLSKGHNSNKFNDFCNTKIELKCERRLICMMIRSHLLDTFFVVNDRFPVGCHPLKRMEIGSQIRNSAFGMVLFLHDYRIE